MKCPGDMSTAEWKNSLVWLLEIYQQWHGYDNKKSTMEVTAKIVLRKKNIIEEWFSQVSLLGMGGLLIPEEIHAFPWERLGGKSEGPSYSTFSRA